jgi:hypothetical protein
MRMGKARILTQAKFFNNLLEHSIAGPFLHDA